MKKTASVLLLSILTGFAMGQTVEAPSADTTRTAQDVEQYENPYDRYFLSEEFIRGEDSLYRVHLKPIMDQFWIDVKTIKEGL